MRRSLALHWTLQDVNAKNSSIISASSAKMTYQSYGLNGLQFASWEVVGKNLLVSIPLICHDSSTDLAKANTMSPASTREDKIAILIAVNHKSTAIQVALAQPFANL